MVCIQTVFVDAALVLLARVLEAREGPLALQLLFRSPQLVEQRQVVRKVTDQLLVAEKLIISIPANGRVWAHQSAPFIHVYF